MESNFEISPEGVNIRCNRNADAAAAFPDCGASISNVAPLGLSPQSIVAFSHGSETFAMGHRIRPASRAFHLVTCHSSLLLR